MARPAEYLEANLFEDDAAVQAQPVIASALIEFQGRLVRNADVRQRPAEDGLHSVPVVRIELRSIDGPRARICFADIPFTDATRQAANDMAKTLAKGLVVIVRAPVADMRVSFPNAESVVIQSAQS